VILQGKVAIVTGSTKGIGRGIARRFAQEGAKVVINGRKPAEVQALVEEILGNGGQAIGVPGDVTQEADVQRLFDETMKAFGTVDILVNNAQTGAGGGDRGPFLKMTADGWNRYVSLNMGALFFCTHRAAKIMAEHRKGSIINISSNAADRPHRQSIAYDSVKGAIDTFSKAVAVDLAPWGIRVNVIRPGMIAATGWENVSEEARNKRRSVIPLGREGFPEDIAWAAVFLAADDAGYVTGQCFQVDGGLLVQGRAPCAEFRPVANPDNIDTYE
jgi:NAD(P)-dependent dehydrogenase (short-subunit alcohol dehydrogenase family)